MGLFNRKKRFSLMFGIPYLQPGGLAMATKQFADPDQLRQLFDFVAEAATKENGLTNPEFVPIEVPDHLLLKNEVVEEEVKYAASLTQEYLKQRFGSWKQVGDMPLRTMPKYNLIFMAIFVDA